MHLQLDDSCPEVVRYMCTVGRTMLPSGQDIETVDLNHKSRNAATRRNFTLQESWKGDRPAMGVLLLCAIAVVMAEQSLKCFNSES